MFMEELNEKIKEIDEIGQKIIEIRQNPILILYYPDDEGTVVEDDIEDIVTIQTCPKYLLKHSVYYKKFSSVFYSARFGKNGFPLVIKNPCASVRSV